MDGIVLPLQAILSINFGQAARRDDHVGAVCQGAGAGVGAGAWSCI